jgi:phytoene desaturase
LVEFSNAARASVRRQLPARLRARRALGDGPRLRDRIVDALERTMLPGLKAAITADFYKTPEDFRDEYRSVHGAGFSVAPIFRQSAWFRFHNKSESVRNLYLVGAGTHPGAGVPGVLCSAKVIDALIPAAS